MGAELTLPPQRIECGPQHRADQQHYLRTERSQMRDRKTEKANNNNNSNYNKWWWWVWRTRAKNAESSFVRIPNRTNDVETSFALVAQYDKSSDTIRTVLRQKANARNGDKKTNIETGKA